MQNKLITQQYSHQYRVEPIKAIDKPMREKQKFIEILKKQVKRDPVTIILSFISSILLTTMVITQVLIAIGKI